MMTEIPVLAVQNSHQIDSLEVIEPAVRNGTSQLVKQWIHQFAPIHPFSVWPLGCWHFLRPLLKESRFYRAIVVVELLDHYGFTSLCGSLLFDPKSTERALAKQGRYLSEILKLPTPAEQIARLLTGAGDQ
jgi:hypothetical protein